MNKVELANMNKVELASMNKVELASLNNVELVSMTNTEKILLVQQCCSRMITMLLKHCSGNNYPVTNNLGDSLTCVHIDLACNFNKFVSNFFYELFFQFP